MQFPCAEELTLARNFTLETYSFTSSVAGSKVGNNVQKPEPLASPLEASAMAFRQDPTRRAPLSSATNVIAFAIPLVTNLPRDDLNQNSPILSNPFHQKRPRFSVPAAVP